MGVAVNDEPEFASLEKDTAPAEIMNELERLEVADGATAG